MTADEEVLSPELEDRLRRGLALLAEETPAPGAAARRRTSRLPAIAVSAAAAIAVVLAGPVLVNNLDGGGSNEPAVTADAPAAPVTDGYGALSQADGADDTAGSPEAAQPLPESAAREEGFSTMGAPPTSGEGVARNADGASDSARMVVAYDLPMLVAESPRIVVGTVGKVRRGAASEASGGLPYVLATVAVEQTLRGPARTQVAAFDYVYGEGQGISGGAQGAVFTEGERVLLFLSDTAGTVHDGIRPKHWQVTGGAQGRYAMKGAEPDAPFTLDAVRAEVERQAARR